jgi:beta-glucosidase
LVGSLVRPVKELRSFQKIFLKKGESKQVSFTITSEELKFYNNDLKQIVEPGDFKMFIGSSSADTKEVNFKLISDSH